MPVHRIAATEQHEVPDASELVRSHRSRADEAEGIIRTLPARPPSASRPRSIFDFDEQETDDR